MINVEKLSKNYARFPALVDVNFHVEKGKIIGLLGPNGAGKTTTMRILTTYLPPSGGSVSIDSFDVCKEAEKVRPLMGYLPETPPLHPELSVQQYLRFVGQIRGLRGKVLQARIEEMLEVCNISAMRGKICGALSKGYRQRVGLAQALLHAPQVLILDEPTSGLDPEQIIQIRQTITSLAGNHTVLLSTHLLQEVTQMCSEAIIIAKGRTVFQGPVTEDANELEQLYLRAVTGKQIATTAEEVPA